MRYVYLGDKLTALQLRGMQCDPVKRDGKCVRGRNGNMLVVDASGKRHVVAGQRLRVAKPQSQPPSGFFYDQRALLTRDVSTYDGSDRAFFEQHNRVFRRGTLVRVIRDTHAFAGFGKVVLVAVEHSAQWTRLRVPADALEVLP